MILSNHIKETIIFHTIFCDFDRFYKSILRKQKDIFMRKIIWLPPFRGSVTLGRPLRSRLAAKPPPLHGGAAFSA